MTSDVSAKELDRCMARVGLFVRRGLGDNRARDLAEQCLYRDRQRVAVRSCWECDSWQRGSERTGPTCLPLEQMRRAAMDARDAGQKPAPIPATGPIHPMVEPMHRCDWFSWAKP